MELYLKIYKIDNHYVIENLAENLVTQFDNIEQMLQYIKQLVLKIEFRSKEIEDFSKTSCENFNYSKTWYIRFSIDRILDILKFAYVNKLKNLYKTLIMYLEKNGLSKSNVRVLTPTFTALKLHVNGEFTDSAIEIGKYLHENDLKNAFNKLYDHVLSNEVLHKIVSKINTFNEDRIFEIVRNILKDYGMFRKDEISYTFQLITYLIRYSDRMKCTILENLLKTYLTGNSIEILFNENDLNSECMYKLTELTLNYVITHKVRYVQEILEKINVSNVNNLSIYQESDAVYLHDKYLSLNLAKIIPKIIVSNENNYAVHVRQVVDNLKSNFIRDRVFSNIQNYLISIITFIRDSSRIKLYLGLISRNGFEISKIIDLP